MIEPEPVVLVSSSVARNVQPPDVGTEIIIAAVTVSTQSTR
jgi:hypothetical protein